MKKTYQAPAVNVVMMAQNLMQAASAQGTAIKGSASSSNEVLSRGGNWDDED